MRGWRGVGIFARAIGAPTHGFTRLTDGGNQHGAGGEVDHPLRHGAEDEEAAEAAGLIIKKGHPVVQVSIYNSAEGVNKIIELPK